MVEIRELREKDIESIAAPFDSKFPRYRISTSCRFFAARGIGTKLTDRAEEIVSRRTSRVGIGAGMPADYGAARRLYVLRGYVPEGRGAVWQNRFPAYGENVAVDDDLVLYFTKELR